MVPWKELGCEVCGTAYDGKTGLDLIRSLRPDMVITDIRMPNMDGLTMLAALHSEYPDIQTTVLTAYRDFEYARQAITLGVCRYLLKPSDLEELKETIRLMASHCCWEHSPAPSCCAGWRRKRVRRFPPAPSMPLP